MSKHRIGFGMAAAALALAGYGTALAGDMSTKAATEMVKCYGVNSCKGQSDCKTAKSECKGLNSCKGQGFKGMASKDACMDAGGTLEM